jgi:hypothetical protein
MFIKISSININNNLDKSLVQSKKIDNDCDEKLKFGHLFALIEINKPGQKSKEISNFIIESLNNNYYLNDKMILSEQLTSLKIESFFEAALVKTGKNLIDYLDKEKINLNFKDLNITTGIIYEGEIYLSNHGANKSFLIRKIKEDYEISDINPEEDQEEQHDNKIFSSIISGEIPNNSYIIISNPSLSEYLLNKEFIEIIDKLNLEGAREQIKNNLLKINNYSNFSGLIVKNCLLEEKMKNSCLTENKQNFRPENNHLHQAESQTERLLTNTGSIDKKNIRISMSKFFNKINIFSFLFKKISNIKRNKNKKERNSDLSIINQSGENKYKKRKIFIFLLVILIAILGGNIYNKNRKEKKIEEQENIANIEEELNQKQKKIEYLIIYNEDQALEEINNLRNEIANLSDKERDKVSNIKEIEEKLQSHVDQVRKMIKVEPIELNNLSLIDNQAESSTISSSGENIYVSDPKNGKIYLVDKDGLSSVLIESENLKSDKIMSANDPDNNSLFINDKQVVKIDKNKKIDYTKINIEDFSQIKSFDVYTNNRIYLLNPEKNQIFRYNLEDGEYKTPSPWVEQDQPEKTTSISVDSSIFILSEDGNIFKYHQGEKKDFETDKIDPVAVQANNIKLSDKYIYISEKTEKRIIIFDKNTGDFIKQYYSPLFSNLKDFTINEDKTIYILNDNIVYKIDIEI